MNNFHNALQQIVAKTSLTVGVEKQTNTTGNITVIAKFSHIEAEPNNHPELEVRFQLEQDDVRILVNLKSTSFDTSSKDFNQNKQIHNEVIATMNTILSSSEIKDLFRIITQADAINLKNAHNLALLEISKSHNLITEETAIGVVNEMVKKVRDLHASTNTDPNSEFKLECYSQVETVTLHDRGTTDKEQVFISLNKRLTFRIDYKFVSKQEFINRLVDRWIPKTEIAASTY